MKKIKLVTKNLVKMISLLLLVGTSFVYAMFQGGFVSWFLLAAFLPIAIYSILLFFYPIQSIQVERVLNKREFSAGDTMTVQMKITLPNRFPLIYLLINDQVPTKIERWSDKSFDKLLLAFFKKSIIYDYEIESIPRGEYKFRGVEVKICDLFGLIDKKIDFPLENQILVYPSYVSLRYNPFENQFEQGATVTKDKVQRDTSMAISVREYQPGDRFSWINWKATARKNNIMTKEFEQRQSHDLLLVLDRTPHPDFELAVTFSASVIRAVLQKGAEIGLYTFGQKPEVLPVRGGQTQQRTMFHYLAGIEDNQAVEFSRIIGEEQSFQTQYQTILFVVSSLNRQVVEQISALSGGQKGKVVLFLVKPNSNQLKMDELSLLELANQRGINAKMVHEGEFSRAFVRGEAV